MSTAAVASPTVAGSPGPATFAASGAKNPKKQEYFARLEALASTHDQVLLVEADNVGSLQMAQIRSALRGRATILMGKNTMIKTCLRSLMQERPQLFNLIDLIKENVGLVFCQDDPGAIRKVIVDFKVPAPAKQGVVAPSDVFIPPGPTGMDPGRTSFFQSLGIPTKIVKGQIEIQNEVHIIKAGEKVSASQAVLLQQLNVKPFSYGLKTTTVWDNGSIYPASALDVTSEDIQRSVSSAVQLVAQLSLGTSYPTKCSAPHSILNAFREVCGVALATDYLFPQLEALKKAMASPGAGAAAGGAATAAAAPATPAAKEEEEEEEDDDMGFGLFD